MTVRRWGVALAGGVLFVAAAACGGDGGGDRSAPDAPAGRRADAPGNVLSQFKQRYDAALAPYGFRVSRAGFTSDVSSESYAAGGHHLAVYAVPTRKLADEEYVAAIGPVAKVFLPEVFDRYPELQSFDVCEEPISDEDEPRPRTQLVISADQAKLVDWSSTTTESLVRGTRSTPNTGNLFVDDDLTTSTAWRAVLSAAGVPS